jgi:pyruvate/2-oxoglutarate dehydrogenase complex dihydrolipoamide acyltransferase (E2) component
MDEGDEVLLYPEEADFFNRDSPGVLVAVTTAASESADSPDTVEGRVQEGSPRDRMFRAENVAVREEATIDISPAALKLAEDNDVDLSQVKGTGADGKILVGDIRRLLE